MSGSDEVVMQKKDENDTVTWREYEALRDHLTGIFDRNATKTDGEIQGVRMQVIETTATVTTMQGQVTELQTSIQQLTQSINALHATVEQRQHGDHGDHDSINGDNEDLFGAHLMLMLMVRAVVVGEIMFDHHHILVLGVCHFRRMMVWESQNFLFPNSKDLLMWRSTSLGS